uniref:Uncharacterized protein n=1 Tax=Poecilia reticulata TaxID=8081 RepID=A0A3P9Q644_POERE
MCDAVGTVHGAAKPDQNQAAEPDRHQAAEPDQNQAAEPDQNQAAEPDRHQALCYHPHATRGSSNPEKMRPRSRFRSSPKATEFGKNLVLLK